MPEITELQVTPAADRRRVHMRIAVNEIMDPPPYLELQVFDPDGASVAEMLIMGMIETTIEITLHVRPPAPAGETRTYTARGRLFFGQEGQQEQTYSIVETSFYFQR